MAQLPAVVCHKQKQILIFILIFDDSVICSRKHAPQIPRAPTHRNFAQERHRSAANLRPFHLIKKYKNHSHSGGFACKSGPCRANEAVNLQLWVAPRLSAVITQTGPGHHEGNSGVSVKPPLPASPAAQPRACQEFLVTFVSQTKVTRPSACEASGAKQILISGTLAVSQNKSRSKPGETAFDSTLAVSQR